MTAWAARLDALPRLLLVTEPTPIIRARRLSAALGSPTLWFKRDDLLPMAFGGNKVRSLDLVVAEALRRGADTLVTGAGPLSNHVRASAAVSALAELRCIAVYWGAAPARAEGNYWLTRMLGRKYASPATLTAPPSIAASRPPSPTWSPVAAARTLFPVAAPAQWPFSPMFWPFARPSTSAPLSASHRKSSSWPWVERRR
jgi:hypothetical protein